MQFANILPFINAEIERLQKARDLLAYIPAADRTGTKSERPGERPIVEVSDLHRLTLETLTPKTVSLLAEAEKEERETSSPIVAEPAAPQNKLQFMPQVAPQVMPHQIMPLVAPQIRVVPYKARRERRTMVSRRRVLPGIEGDPAVRSVVPAGPVIVSAAEVRKAQAARVEPSARTTPSTQETAQFLGWRDRAAEVRSAEALLQRWISRASAE